MYTDSNGFATLIVGTVAPNTLVATPGTYASGGIRFNGSTNKLQFTHDLSTWTDMGGGGSFNPAATNDLFPAATDTYSSVTIHGDIRA
jgi:hypothetical protein